MQEQATNKEKEMKLNWKRLLNYQSVVRQLPFFLFLTFLAVLYIYNGHYADNTLRDITKTTKEVKELQYEYKTVKSEVMFRSQQSQLAKAVEPLGLKIMTEPPVLLNDSAEGKE
jgi:cell division protein FtsB